MKRRNALSAMAGLAASSALGGGVATGLPQALADEAPLPQRYRALSPVRDKAPIVVANLGVGLSMISGPGGNVTALAGQDGVVLGDSFVPGRGADLAAVVRKLGDGPVTLINTDWHLDHTGGNAALAKIGARIVAHPSVRDRLGSDQYMADFEMKVPPSQAAALPVVTLGDSATLFLNGEEVHLRHVAPAHTD